MNNQQILLTIALGGKTLSLGKDTEIKLVDVEGLESPDYEISVQNNAQFDGGTVTGRRAAPRSILITGECGCSEDTERQRAALIRFFNPASPGQLTVDYCGVVRRIGFELESFKAHRANLYEPLTFLAGLLCPDPYFRDVDEHGGDMAAKRGLLTAPFVLKPEGAAFSVRTMRQEVEILNDGDKPTGFVVAFHATDTVLNPSFESLTTGEKIRVNVRLQAGDVLTVSTLRGQKRIELGGKSANHLLDPQSTLFQLQRGVNVLKYGADSGYTALSVYPKWSAEYLGV